MNKKLKYMTIDEFMNTMKRRGTADLTSIQQELLSPKHFKEKMVKLEEYYDKQRSIQQKVQLQTKNNQIYYKHYYMQEGAKHSRSNIKIGSFNNLSIISEKQIQVSNEAKQTQYQPAQQFKFQKSNFNSQNNLNSEQELIDQNDIQSQIIDQIHHLYGRQRLFSPPQEKRDLDNLQDYFKKSRNYQSMNKVIRQNSCECNNCGGRCFKTQSMKGIIPQFVPRQVIRDSLKKKWKKASKTLRKLCFFFKLAAGGHTRPKNLRAVRNKTNVIVNNQAVQQAINIMSVQVNYNSESNEHVRQILQNDPNFPPFLNLKGGQDQSMQLNTLGLESKQPSLLSVAENTPIKSPSPKKQDYLDFTQKSIQKQDDDNIQKNDSSCDSIDKNECLSPSQVRKALKNVNDNFIKELTQRRNIREKTKKMTQTYLRSEIRKKTQNFNYLMSQSQKIRNSKRQEELKIQIPQQPRYQTAYQKFFQKPGMRLIDVVSQKLELNSNNSSGNFSFQKYENIPSQFQGQLKSCSTQNSPFMKYSKINLATKNDKNFLKSQNSKSNKNQDFVQMVDLMNQTSDSIKTAQENVDQINYLNTQESQIVNQFTQASNKNNYDEQQTTSYRSYFKNKKFNEKKSQSQHLPYLNNNSTNNKNDSRQVQQYSTYLNSNPRNKIDQTLQKKISYSVFQQLNSQKENSMRISSYKNDQEQSIQMLSEVSRGNFQPNYKNKQNNNKIFNNQQAKQIQKDINHLRMRSLNICLNQQQDQIQQMYFQSQTQSPKISQLLTPQSKKSLPKFQTALPHIDLNQNKHFKDEESLSYGILKRLNQKKPTVSIKFEI